MKFDVWGQTDVGLKRDINQDSILVDNNLGLFIVADGMGGHRGGEVASALAVETSQEVFENQHNLSQPKDLIRTAFKEASRRIYSEGQKNNKDLQDMGTTMVLSYTHGNYIYVGNVGDSRAYLYKEGKLWQMTEDHSLVNEQIKAGIISAHGEPVVGRNVITRSVGYEAEVNVDVVEREVFPGELYLMCSDGLCGLISDEKISELCASESPKTIVEECIEAAKLAGGDDNISVLVMKVLS